ncbi:MAG: SDR family NAD(P)-dependent oxidoreductase [Candidatus Scalindua sp.]|nr:SDR family NAD(P)-dependent oxidoreductase [Candidatus Scalindua sp.]MBT6049927.1 SDR family NAD(P)-dependent oxidoreductase [Candidatus Scalindua sp.]MBT6226612.1 SDR family NAD(P)-dependent oxidoreductase [Candidatus Scalindua sp.]
MNLTNKKILVTGADGFIGSHLVEALLNEGCNIKAFVFYNSFNSWGWLDTLPKEKLNSIEIIAGDIRDPNGVRTALKDIDIVFHLAALIAIPFSYHSPDSYVDTNVKGTLNVLQACRDYDVERVIVTSTSEVYGTAQYVPINETHPLQAQSPYSASKIGADKIAESFFRSFEMPVVIARPFNAYGPRQSARAIIPTIITQLLSGNEDIRLGSLHPTRDFNYVRDICNGLILLSKFDEAIGKEVNIGSNTEISIGTLADMLIKLLNAKVKIVTEDLRKRPDKSEVERLVCDNSLIKEITSWEPETLLKDGLLETIEWFNSEENMKRYKGDIYNI